MALYYLESSALVKLYVREAGTDRMLAIATPQNQLCILSLSQVELRSAIRRRERGGDLSPKIAGYVLDLFQQHLSGTFLKHAVNQAVLKAAADLIDRHPLRSFDALQLAGCLALRAFSKGVQPVFACADQALLRAARSEKLPVFDPCLE